MKPRKLIRALLVVLVALPLTSLLFLWLKPPDLLRVGANYAAKIVCSNVFLADRDPDEVLRSDVQAPGVAILKLIRVTVDRERHIVRAGFLGFIGNGLAVARPGVGCAAVPDGNLEFAIHASTIAARIRANSSAADFAVPSADIAAAPSAPVTTLWPDGDEVTTIHTFNNLLADDTLAGPGMRALVVVDHGRIVAERYAGGFSKTTPLLGWSMTKSVVAGLIGLLVKDGKMTLDQSGGWPVIGGDARNPIKISDLLAMSSGLSFNETYGAVSDVTRMLYLQPDMAAFARAQPAIHPPGDVWSYSSGTANILSGLLQSAAGPVGAAFPATRLFTPLGMTTATMETDEDGTLVGSSYMYATARDWARYGLFLAQDGIWQGQELLPRGYVAMMTQPVAASRGEYGHGLVWLWGSDAPPTSATTTSAGGGVAVAVAPAQNPDAAFGIPPDCFWMEGHDGQSIAIIPSRQLIVVRLGLTPATLHYTPQALVGALLKAQRR